jgi:hypothetical protein
MKPTNKYPIFEPDQVLTSKHLNDAIAYLESTGRHSRRLLHGVGIVCGLRVTRNDNTIIVSRGVGITSEGYLVYAPDDLYYSKVRDYRAPKPPLYHPFAGDNDEPLLLKELIPEDELEGDNLREIKDLTANEINRNVLVIYLEMLDQDLKSCTGNDCDNKGIQRRFGLRVLMCDKDLLQGLGSSQTSGVKPLKLPRFDVTATAPDSSSAILNSYYSIGNAIIPELAKHLAFAGKYATGEFPGETEISGILRNTLEDVKSKRFLYIQYVYDYFSVLADAANELYEKALDFESSCAPATNLFPRHLMLTGLQELVSNTRPVYRHYFIAAQVDRQQHHLAEELVFLTNRLKVLIDRFEIHNQLPIRVTPGRYGDVTLSRKAIPYYLQKQGESYAPLLESWNYRLSIKGLADENKHYFHDPEPGLRFDHENLNFYRIEGHVGKPYREVLRELDSKFKSNRLPVDLVALRLTGPPGESERKLLCHFQDLDSLYENLKSKIICGLQREQCFFASLEQTPSVAGVRMAVSSEPDATVRTESEMDATFDTSFAARLDVDLIRLSDLKLRLNLQTYQRGDFLKSHCTIKPNTIGSYYLELLKLPQYAGRSFQEVISPYLYLLVNNQSLAVLYIFSVYPLVIIDSIEKTAGELIRDTIADTDHDKLTQSLSDLKNFVRNYRTLLKGIETGQNNELRDRIARIDARLAVLESLCMVSQLRSLFEEYQKRARALLERLHFAKFIKEHSGINFKAGVPKGGTFIVVYHGVVRSRPSLSRADVITSFDVNDRVMSAGLSLRDSASESTGSLSINTNISELQKEASFNVSQLYQNQDIVLQQFASQLGVINRTGFLAGLQGLIKDFTQPANDLQITEGTVVADFYLPYLCASDCMPVQLNFPEDPVSVSLLVRSVCSPHEEGPLQFMVSPQGGALTGEGVESSDGQWYFNPKSVGPGRYTFVYTLGERSAETRIDVLVRPVADFDYSFRTSANGSELFLVNRSLHADQFRWDLGDGNTSELANVNHFYPPEIQEVSVVLHAFNQTCENEIAKVIRFEEEDNFSLRIGTSQFCGNDRNTYELTLLNNGQIADPGNGTIEGRGINGDNGRFSFNPAIAGVGQHTLSYVLNNEVKASIEVSVVQPFDVSFEILEHGLFRGNYLVHIGNIRPEIRADYQWQFEENGASVNRNNNDPFTHSYSLENLKPGTQVTINLHVNGDPCSGFTQRSFVVEYEIPGNDPFSRPNVSSRLDVVERNLRAIRNNADFQQILPENSPVMVGTVKVMDNFRKATHDDTTFTKLRRGNGLKVYIEEFSGIIENINRPTPFGSTGTTLVASTITRRVPLSVEAINRQKHYNAIFSIFGVNYNLALELGGLQESDLAANNDISTMIGLFTNVISAALKNKILPEGLKAEYKLMTDTMILMIDQKPNLKRSLTNLSKILV